MPTRVFHRSELEEMGAPFDLPKGVELSDEQIDTRRWASVHRLIFRAPDDGKVYAVTYEQGLTEVQEGHDEWGYADHIVGDEMEQYEATVKQWRAAP